MLRSKIFTLILTVIALSGLLTSARPENREPIGQSGQFDLFLLSLSWSPAFCASPAGQRPSNVDQCGAGARFVIHGLWPQAKSGRNPQYCAPTTHVRPEEAAPIMTGTLRVLPGSQELLDHEWSKHGTCSGMNAREYFERTARAAALVKVPDLLLNVANPQTKSAGEIQNLFIQSNPGLKSDQVVAKMDRSGRFYELVICMDKQLEFIKCQNVQVVPPNTRGIVLPPQAPTRPTGAGAAAAAHVEQ